MIIRCLALLILAEIVAADSRRVSFARLKRNTLAVFSRDYKLPAEQSNSALPTSRRGEFSLATNRLYTLNNESAPTSYYRSPRLFADAGNFEIAVSRLRIFFFPSAVLASVPINVRINVLVPSLRSRAATKTRRRGERTRRHVRKTSQNCVDSRGRVVSRTRFRRRNVKIGQKSAGGRGSSSRVRAFETRDDAESAWIVGIDECYQCNSPTEHARREC